MGKIRSERSSKSSRSRQKSKSYPQSTKLLPTQKSRPDPSTLLVEAAELLQAGQPEAALPLAQNARSRLSSPPLSAANFAIGPLPALPLLGEIQLELGDAAAALKTFLAAASIDPDGDIEEAHGGGAEKFLWLAQLCERGGRESIGWFERGIAVLERQIQDLEKKKKTPVEELEDKKRKLAEALCGMVEVWMTDLSLEPEAEATCDSLMTRALMVSPMHRPSTLQTLASVRLSQSRIEDAQSALTRSVDIWKDLPPEHEDIPDFPTRVSLARLLMEAEMEPEALDVVERLVGEDDQCVEAWYLGGWCLWLMAANAADAVESGNDPEQATESRKVLLMSSREWLRNCLKLYGLLDYEDERLKEHASELVQGLDQELGDAEIEDEDEEWIDESGDQDSAEENDEEDDEEMDGT